MIFLHHSTGSNVWGGGVPEWFTQYNADNGTNYSISELAFPDGENYPWANYPYDYWYLWVENGGPDPVEAQPTLEMLTTEYDVIVFKHCFPVSSIVEDNGTPDISSEEKTIANYQLQYAALKEKLHSFSDTRFVVWTGAANVAGATNEADAARARTFFDWVKTEWDESGDNIYIWDFFELETEGGIYLLEEYAAGATDSHPNESFCQYAAPLFSNRVVNVITGRGDATGILGE
ncbi:MAG: hypothetical protein JXR45_15840 [Deltaproteobacteria bacterium]|nr:hypothetical protein [Deltaproteobacteria bacterium]